MKIDIAFLFIGGAHQVYHLAPVAAELSRLKPDLAIGCLCADGATYALIKDVRDHMDAPLLKVQQVSEPVIGWIAEHITHSHSAGKLPLLGKMLFSIHGARAIVVPERTSAILRQMGWRRPLIHFRHGAGDRAPKSEKRLKAFDLIVVPGEKDVARAVETQHVDPDRLRISGYVKLDYIAEHGGKGLNPLFPDDRPVVVYNPHFDADISSWPLAVRVLDRFAAQDRYNLIFAPHMRVSQDMGDHEKAVWRSRAVPGRIIIDLDSPRLVDMTYLRQADVYLGDMSSQLYEFLIRPRPVAFINAHQVQWRNDPRYAGWHLGEVVDDADEVMTAIDRAIDRHVEKREAQERAVHHAIGPFRGASRTAAHILIDALHMESVDQQEPPLAATI